VGIRQVLGTAAGLALALHTALWGIAPTYAGYPVDPFAVICHSGTTAPASPAADDNLPTPGQPCDHCNLCSVAVPPIPPDTTLVADFRLRTLQVLYPANVACKGDVIADSRSARGPPAFA
jgi:hypothetical protein